MVAVVMRTAGNFFEGDLFSEPPMNGLEGIGGHEAAADIWLVGDDEGQKASRSQPADRVMTVTRQNELVWRAG